MAAEYPEVDPTTIPHEGSAQALAERVAQVMYQSDAASQLLGMKIEAVRLGYARLSMQVRDDMVNGHHTCHGGLIFSLADSAFAFACNSDNRRTVAAGAAIEFLRPGYAGDVLTAEAEVRVAGEKTGIYDIAVRNQNGETIALFRGKSHRVRGEVVATESTPQH